MRDRVLSIQEDLQQVHEGVNLNLGCGGQIWKGWINIDQYHLGDGVYPMDIQRLAFASNSADRIHSSHSLEHLPIRHGLRALQNWNEVLKPGGDLYLMVPDLEAILQRLVDPHRSLAHKVGWDLHTLFGWQADSGLRQPSADTPLDLGQFHQSGYTRDLLRAILGQFGFSVLDIFSYDGWDTPSLFCYARKSGLRV